MQKHVLEERPLRPLGKRAWLRIAGARVLLIVLTATMALTPGLLASDAPNAVAGAGSRKTQLHREGTQLHDEPGQFLAVGTRLTFVSASGTRYIGLENLNLERVGKIVATSTEAVEWLVSGTITEYQGSNYLLIGRARRKVAPTANHRAF